MPRSSQQIVEELRALLLNAGIEGPFVLAVDFLALLQGL